MTPDMALSSAQTVSLLSSTKSNPAPQEEPRTPSIAQGGQPAKESKQTAVDTVSLSPLLQQAFSEVQKKEATKPDLTIATKNETSGVAASKVDFVYDVNGELVTKYLDTANRLVYQTPSELMLRMRESAAKSEVSVNMKA